MNGELPMLENSKLENSPTTQPRRIAVGDTLSISVPQLVGPGVEPKSMQTVAASGAVTMPMVDQISVTGMTESEAANAISGKYREAKLIPDASATVTIATTQPSTQAAMPAPPTSQPDGADLVDVVILVKPEEATTQPSTQPTSQPSTQPGQ